MFLRKWWIPLSVIIIGGTVWFAIRSYRAQPSEDEAVLFIQKTAFRESPSQEMFDTASSKGMTAMEYQRLCAVNCLYFLNRLHGVHSTYEDVKLLLQPGEVGVSMGHLAEVIKAYGYKVKPMRLTHREMFKKSDVMIVLATPAKGPQAIGHFGVVVPVPSRKGCWFFDPPRKKMWVSQDQMKEENQTIPVLCLKQSQ